MIRLALLVCSVAYVTTEADAYHGYGGYGGYGHLGYAGYGGPVAHAHSTGPHLPNVVQHVPYGYAACGVYRAANAGALHLAKRPADADAFHGYGGYGGYGYLGYAASGVSRAANAGALHLAKRSADADAFHGYGGYGGYGYLGYAGYGGPVAHAHSTGPHLPNVV